MAYIYVILNTETQTPYVGSTFDLQKRWNDHKNKLAKDKHYNIHLQRSYNKYGITAFTYSVIEQCEDDKEYVEELETFYIQTYKEIYGSSFNIVKFGEQNKGMRMSEETKQRISKAVRIWQANPEYRRRVSEESKDWFSNDSNKELHRQACKDALKRPEVKERNRLRAAKEWGNLISPDGVIYLNVTDLLNFSKQHELSYTSLKNVCKGFRENYKGWKKYKEE